MSERKERGERRFTERRRRLVQAGAGAGALATSGAALPFIASLAPSERAKALGAPVEVDLSVLEPGRLLALEWQGKPIWILRRTEDMLTRLAGVREALADPDSRVPQQPEAARNATRSLHGDVLVTVALCTHLGCVPTYRPEPGSVQPDWPGGFYCPCHGSKFDLAGRVYKGSPAPTNLVVPPHAYAGEHRIVVGVPSARSSG
jgi:ubiquinol-cytochrome c reductase iron-sulfur subunit